MKILHSKHNIKYTAEVLKNYNMILTEKILLEKGLDNLKDINKFTYTCRQVSPIIKQVFFDDKENFEVTQKEYISDLDDIEGGWSHNYIYEIKRITPEMKKQRHVDKVNKIVKEIEKEYGVELLVVQYNNHEK